MSVIRVKLFAMLQLPPGKIEEENEKLAAAGRPGGTFVRQTPSGSLPCAVVFDDLRNGRTRPGPSFFIRP